jgi:hypothetical protein
MATKRRKWIIGIVGGVILAVILPVLVILPWAASNAFAAGYYLIFTTKPNRQELLGRYKVAQKWGTAELLLREDDTFQETIRVGSKSPQIINGRWSDQAADAGHAAQVTMTPYLEVHDDEWGRSFSYASLNFYKPRFGPIFAELDPDTGSRFIKQ